jgi:Fungal specific transcription factor domain
LPTLTRWKVQLEKRLESIQQVLTTLSPGVATTSAPTSQSLPGGPPVHPRESPINTTSTSVESSHEGINLLRPEIRLLDKKEIDRLFSIYHNRLEHYIYGIADCHTSYESARQASSLLAASILTVAALHSGDSKTFAICYEDFVNIAQSRMFSSRCNLDDIRGFCIGAFWLGDLSWILASCAVRLATELKLGQCYNLAIQGDKEAFERVRLWYFVYVCDHHFSIAYGRQPLSGLFRPEGGISRFLQSKHCTEPVRRLISQVSLWSQLQEVQTEFGLDVSNRVPVENVEKLQQFIFALQWWYTQWERTFNYNKEIGNYPNKGVYLHHQFARLYLCSHALRGISDAGLVAPDLISIAREACKSALYIVDFFINDSEVQSYLNGLPLYFDTMACFAAVFLLKLDPSTKSQLETSEAQIFHRVDRLVEVFGTIAQTLVPHHVLSRIRNGIQKLSDEKKLEAVSPAIRNEIQKNPQNTDTFVAAASIIPSKSTIPHLPRVGSMGPGDSLNGGDLGSTSWGKMQLPTWSLGASQNFDVDSYDLLSMLSANDNVSGLDFLPN